MFRRAEHPGYRSKRDEERGGTRGQVARARVSDAVNARITRNPTRKELAEAAARVRQEQADLEEAKRLARAAGVREPTRKVTGKTLRKLRRQARAARRTKKNKKKK